MLPLLLPGLLLQATSLPERPVGDFFAASVAGIGDVDGDGKADFVAATGSSALGPAVAAFSGGSGALIWTGANELHLSNISTRSLCPVGDVNGDGRVDVAAIGRRKWTPAAGPRPPSAPEIVLLCGRDGTTLRSFSVESGLNDPALAEIACLADIDGDSVSDLAVVAATSGSNPRSAAWFQSCATGEVLRWLERDPHWWMTAEWIDCPGDVDGDGISDVVTGVVDRNTVSADPWAWKPSAILVRSGRDGRRLFGIPVPPNWAGFRACKVGDVDRDRRVDVAIGSVAGRGFGGSERFEVHVHSGADGRLLREFSGLLKSAKNGQLASAGDFDRDGFGDILQSEYENLFGGVVRVISGRDGSSLQTFGDPGDWPPFSEHFGYSLAWPGDVDGDGIPDGIVGQCNPRGDQPGRLQVFSGKDGKRLYALDRTHLVRMTKRR